MEPLSRDEVRAVDRRAIEELGIPGVVLMENAGAGFARLLLAAEAEAVARSRECGAAEPVAILCGGGNNAGDGWVIARHLHNAGVPVRVGSFADPDRLPPDARTNRDVAVRMGLDVVAGDPARALAGATLVVDALLGTGARGPLRAPYDEVLARANAAPARRAAVDLPSGLDADTGAAAPGTFRADRTGTFVAPKVGFGAPGAAAWTGVVHVIGIGVPPELVRAVRTRS